MPEASTTRTVDDYVASLPEHQAEVVRRLRALVRQVAPEARESIKWAQPVYESNGPFAYIKAFKNYVNFGFWRGADLDDPKHLLTGAGSRMAHVSLRTADEISDADLEAFVASAVRLNQQLGDPTRRTAR